MSLAHNVKLTRTERLILANQFRILSKVFPEEASAYENYYTIVTYGYALHYDNLFQSIEAGLSEDQCTYVFDVLQMFSDLHYGYESLPDKSGIDVRDIQFTGFDGNNETELLCYAEYVINTLGRYEELKRHDFNSHMPTSGLYNRMLNAWRPFTGSARGMRQLSKSEITTVLAARTAR